MTMGQCTDHAKSTPYSIDKCVSYAKVRKNFNCFISTVVTNVVLRILVYGQRDPK